MRAGGPSRPSSCAMNGSAVRVAAHVLSAGGAALRLFPRDVGEAVEVAARQSEDGLKNRDGHQTAQSIDAECLNRAIETVDGLA